MTFKDRIPAYALCLLLAVQCLSSFGAKEQPNFIFIMSDDQGWGDLGSYGHPSLRTPQLDQLAKEGMIFTQFYTSASICTPTRAGFMTGQFPARVGVHSQISTAEKMQELDSAVYLDPKYPMLPRALQGVGYHTMHIGKWHLSPWLHRDPILPRPDAYGFTEYLTPYLNWPETKYGKNWAQPTHRARSSELFVDQAIQYIEKREQDKTPFYLQVWLLDPHVPLIPESDQMRHYDDLRVKQPYIDNPDADPTRIYSNVLSEMDAQLGRLFESVRNSGLAENTFIIFTSDNGAATPSSYDYYVGTGSNGPFRGEKGSLYEGGFRVPLIVWRPGHVPAGKVDRESISSLVDFFPTMAALGQAATPANLDGVDIQKVWEGSPMVNRPPLFWEWRYNQPRTWQNRSPMLAVRDGDWKLLMNPDDSRVELFNLRLDPMENGNMAEQQPQIVSRLRKELLEFHQSLPGEVFDKQAGNVSHPLIGKPGSNSKMN